MPALLITVRASLQYTMLDSDGCRCLLVPRLTATSFYTLI
jgi:hypothetical protein